MAGRVKRRGQKQAVPLASGQRVHGLAGALGREEKIREVAHHLPALSVEHDVVAPESHRFNNRLCLVQLGAVLVEVSHLERGAVLHGAGPRLGLPQEEVEQGGLARTVGSDDPDIVTPDDGGRKVVDEAPFAIAEVQILSDDHAGARAVCLLDCHAYAFGALPALRAFHPQTLEGLYAPLIPGPAGLDALADPFLLLRQVLVENRPLPFLARQHVFLSAQVGRVVAGPRGEPAAVQLHDPGSESLEEGAVVGDEEQAPDEAHQEGLEPLDAIQVEMVSGFVQQEDVRLRGQRPAQQRASLLPTRERVEPRGVVQLEKRAEALHGMVWVGVVV